MSVLACPLDGLALEKRGNSLYCPQNHCFDIDRKGAVNLLPVQLKQSKNPGDSKEMVLARSHVLNSGLYQPVAEKLAEIIAPYPGIVFDAGCGEGYYLDYLYKARPGSACIGMDISKDAIHAASRRNKEITWCVGTNKAIPVQNESVDVIICLFGFPVYAEFHRILKPGGILVMVDPGSDHLIELRRILYPEIRAKAEKEDQIEGFQPVDARRLVVAGTVPNPELLHDILMMTPHGYRSLPERIAAATAQLAGQKLTLDVRCFIYRKVV